MTDTILIDLMSDIDVALLDDDYMERDMKRMEKSWISSIVHREKRAKAMESACDGLHQTVKEKRKQKMPDYSPLSYEWGEAIRTDLEGKFHDGVSKMKRKASAAAGFIYGILTMAVVAISFVALLGKKEKII